MSDQQNPNPNPYNQAPQQQGYAPNGYAQPQQPQGYPQGSGLQPQQPQYGYQPAPQQGYQQPGAAYGYHQPGFAPRHSLPGGAIFAAIVWVIFGALYLIGALMQLASGRPQPISLMIALALGIVFTSGAITTFMGKAKSLLGPAIVAIIFGALTLLAMLFVGSLFRGLGGAGGVVMLIGVVIGGLLLTSGIIGCITNKKYKEYHHTKHGY